MPKTVKQTLYGADLDLTDYHTINRAKLMEYIEDDCNTALLFANRHHPDKMFVTLQQFNVLEDDMQRIDEHMGRIYQTKKGFVMEVHIVDRPDWDALLERGDTFEVFGGSDFDEEVTDGRRKTSEV